MTDADHECVLVVDDDDDVRESMREVVEMGGCRALVAANGAEALQVLAHRKPCLVIVDLMMPVMSGTDLLAAMSKQPELAKLPVVIATSAPHRAPQGHVVLAKPIDVHVIWEWMRRTCHCASDSPS